MSRILVTGSAQGVGAECARQLIQLGHDVVVHGRNPLRSAAAIDSNPGAVGVLTGALDSIEQTIGLGRAANDMGPFDAVVHNAGAGPHQDAPVLTPDGLEYIFHVNTVSPYVLSCTMDVAPRVVYVGSDASLYGEIHLDDLQWVRREWSGAQAYADSKLGLAVIATEMARRHPDSSINVVHPGWVRTAMGGPQAAKPVDEGADGLVWLATSTDQLATGTGQFFFSRERHEPNPLASSSEVRDGLLDALQGLTGMELP